MTKDGVDCMTATCPKSLKIVITTALLFAVKNVLYDAIVKARRTVATKEIA